MSWKEFLKKRLTEEEYKVTQERATEKPFSGEYNQHFEKWIYRCKICLEPLFSSKAKFDSGCWWPSFDQPINNESVWENIDLSHNMIRTEITCNRCWSHLWHLFLDWPTSNGNRYCVNSVSLKFQEK
jgi:peptide-methionine (R)-S-oxide reductase